MQLQNYRQDVTAGQRNNTQTGKSEQASWGGGINRNYPGKDGVWYVKKHKGKPGIEDRISKGPFSITGRVYCKNYNQFGS